MGGIFLGKSEQHELHSESLGRATGFRLLTVLYFSKAFPEAGLPIEGYAPVLAGKFEQKPQARGVKER